MTRPAIHGMLLEHGKDGYTLSWWMKDDAEWEPWTLRLTEAEAALVKRCHNAQEWVPEFEALLRRGAPPMGAWVP